MHLPPQHPSLRKFCLMNSSIIEPLLVFMAHAIRMHDSRCCGVVLKVFRSIIPEFRGLDANMQRLPPVEPVKHAPPPDNFLIPEETTHAVREFICSDVLKACITSLHEHHFVDMQRELGNVMAAIVANYSPLTRTPRDILASLPNIAADDVDSCLAKIHEPNVNQRMQRGLILDLLKDLKGVSIAEMGKVQRSNDFLFDGNGVAGGGGAMSGSKKKSGAAATRSKMQQEFMTAPPSGPAGGVNGQQDGRNSPDLTGVAGLFDA